MNNINIICKELKRRIDSLIHHDEVKKVLKDTIKTGELPNLLFYGPPGSGKTSAIIALGYELFGPYLMNERILELNASDERGIKLINSGELNNFCNQKLPYSSSEQKNYANHKLIIFDEADNITKKA